MRLIRLLTAAAVLLAVAVTVGPVSATFVSTPASVAHSTTGQGLHEPSPASRDRTLDLRDAYVEEGRTQWRRSAGEVPGRVAPRPSEQADGSGGLFWDPTAPRERLCGAGVCVHYVTATSDAPPPISTVGTIPDWVRRNLAVAELSLARMAELGYPDPPADDGRGGDDRFDIYLADISRAGLYGFCAPEEPVPGAPGHASSYCVFDNDFLGFPMPADESLRVTAAHELFHAVQFGMDVREDRWFLESTATWMEEQVADDVNDNRQFLSAGQLAERRTPLDLSAADLGSYGNWIFFQFLAQRHGVDAVRQIWALADAGPGLADYFSVQAIGRFVERRGASMTEVYTAFASANLVPRRVYDEGASYRRAAFDETVRLGRGRQAWRESPRAVRHLTSRAIMVRARPGLPRASRLRITVDASRARGAAAVALVFRRSGTVARVPVTLDGRGDGRRVVDFGRSRVRRVVVLLANASVRYDCGRETQLACGGVPREDRQRFSVSLTVVHRPRT